MNDEMIAKNLIVNRLNEYCVDNEYSISVPNYQYEEVIDSPLIGIYFMGSSYETVLLNNSKLILGMFQINISIPNGTGTYLCDKIKSELLALFDIKTIIRDTMNKIYITDIYGSGSVTGDAMYTDTLTVEFKKYTN